MADNENTIPNVLVWQKKDGSGVRFEVEKERLPELSQHVLMQRGLTHILGNEGAAKDMTEEELQTWREERVQSLYDGTFSIRETGPRLPTEEKLNREYSQAVVIALAKAEGWSGVQKKIGGAAAEMKAMPKASDKESWVKLHEAFMSRLNLAKAAKAWTEAELKKRAAVPMPDFEVEETEATA